MKVKSSLYKAFATSNKKSFIKAYKEYKKKYSKDYIVNKRIISTLYSVEVFSVR